MMSLRNYLLCWLSLITLAGGFALTDLTEFLYQIQ